MLGGGKLEIRILTPVPQILVENRPVDVGSPKARLVLAVLAESVGRPVPTSTLIDRVWGEAPPDSVHTSVYAYCSRIRRSLKDAGVPTDIKRRSRTYTLEVDPDAVDWHRARSLSAQARKLTQRGEHAAAFALLEEALELWDGEPLTEFSGVWADSLRRRMAQGHRRLLGQWAEVGLVLGGPEETLLRLEDHPGDETLAYLHMKALEMCGRHTEAIECYTDLRDHTIAELGIQPSPRTRALFQRILTEADGDEGQWVEPVPLAEPRREVVDTLRADVSDFLGRDEELETLLTSVRASEGRTAVHLIHGLGGVGKTTLAAHAAHRLRDAFDVRLQTDLTGASSDQVLFRLLLMLGVSGSGIPTEPEARVALWRNQVAGRRVLLLLDNADHHDQVMPVIPGAAGSVVLVTSRRSLAGLHGARRLWLRPLDEEDAIRMFAVFSGRDVEEEGMSRVVALADRLPLGLWIASAQLRRRFTWSLDRLANHLERHTRASEQGADSEALAVFIDTYEALDVWARQVFLCVGLHPTTVVPDHAAAASVGDWDKTEKALDELIDVHFLDEVSPGRYRMHDSVRRFARQRAARTMSERQRWEVERRILDYYLATVDNADRTAMPGRRRTERPITRSSATPGFESPREAREWFADTFPSVERVIEHARERGFTEYVARIPLAMAGLLETNGPWDRAEKLFVDAVEAWRGLRDPLGTADALYELAVMRLKLMDRGEVEELLGRAIALWEECGRRQNIPYARDQVGLLHADQDDHLRAISEYRASLDEFQALGDQRGIAKVYNHLALSQSETGRHHRASSHFLVSKQLYQALGDEHMAARVAMNLFQMRFGEGRHREARAMNERCMWVFRAHGDALGIASTQHNRGLLESYLGRYGDAYDSFQSAQRGFWSAGDVTGMIRSKVGVGTALLGLGRISEAERTLLNGLELAETHDLALPRSPLLRALGDVRSAQQRRSEAEVMYQEARGVAARTGAHQNEGMCCSRLGDLSSLKGDSEKALSYWAAAVRHLERKPTPYLEQVRSKIKWFQYVRGQAVG
ncbi:transcriptional regulator, SARP family [Nocardiopsis sp. JB363]|nr:transcriptional regulator, SARP family [Nocardiopsis sp. JB363]